MEMEKKRCQSLEKNEKKIEGQITDWMLECVLSRKPNNKNLLCISATELVKTWSRFENQEEALAVTKKEQLQDKVTDSEEQLNGGDLPIFELECQ